MKTRKDEPIPSWPILPFEISLLLRDLEWVGGIHGYHCQICNYNHDLGHDPRCPLVKVFPKTKVFKPGRGWDKQWVGLDRYDPRPTKRKRK